MLKREKFHKKMKIFFSKLSESSFYFRKVQCGSGMWKEECGKLNVESCKKKVKNKLPNFPKVLFTFGKFNVEVECGKLNEESCKKKVKNKLPNFRKVLFTFGKLNVESYLKIVVRKTIPMKDYTSTQLEPGKTYHIYNRANGNELLFCNDDNYLFFLQQVKRFIVPVANIYAYSLLPNHLHFLIRLKEEPELYQYFSGIYQKRFESVFKNYNSFGKLVSKNFSNLFSSYSQSFNRQQNRKGNLFNHKFKRLEVSEPAYFLKLVHYIHLNPVEAGLCKEAGQWKYSSY